jgi:monoamine oxidase
VTAFGRPQRAVSRIEHHGSRINVKTSRGTVGAARVIVTVPTAAIADEHLVFDPPLPNKVAAASGLPLGLANKLFLQVEGTIPGADAEFFLVGSTRRRETMNYQVRPLGRPRINCFFGGRFAARLERDGIEAMAAFAADELAGLFGSDIRRQLRPLAASSWRADPPCRRLLLLCAARPCRRPRPARRTGRRPAVFRRRSHLA